ncbi:DUF3574 domain-containing protein [Streptomyces sp. NPDC048275]|uniref:DUF3574 domain-containing protein n=1 Tax=Streptomyces sp. NPDC048275 TaxID=3155629 RepID=UPI003408B763
MTPLSTRARMGAALATTLLVAGTPAAYVLIGDGDSDERPRTTAHQAYGAAPGRGVAYIETRLLFGTERPDGGPAVSDRQFKDFIDRRVTPAFPDGLTVQDGRGQWRDAHGTIERERSYELILLYPQAAADASDRKVEEIRTAYEKTFGQESVGRVDDRVGVDF